MIREYNGHKLNLYSSIEELPIVRYQMFNRYLAIDTGIGSSAEDVDKLIGEIKKYNEVGDKVNVDKLLNNLMNCFLFMINNSSPLIMSFVPLIKSIDGKEVTDLSNESVKEVIARLDKTKLSIGQLKKWLSEVKKNWTKKLRSIFQKEKIHPIQ